jgi:hypothetical protein
MYQEDFAGSCLSCWGLCRHFSIASCEWELIFLVERVAAQEEEIPGRAVR